MTDSENVSKQAKIGQAGLQETLDNFLKAFRKENREENEKNRAEIGKLSEKLVQTEKSIGAKFDQLSEQMTDLQNKQTQ